MSFFMYPVSGWPMAKSKVMGKIGMVLVGLGYGAGFGAYLEIISARL